MEERDIDYHQVCDERDALLAHNQQLIEELNALKSQNKRQGEAMKAAVKEVKHQIEADAESKEILAQKADESSTRVNILQDSIMTLND